MKKKLFLLASIFLLISSFILIDRLQDKNFAVFNTVSKREVQLLQKTREETEKLQFTALLCNETRVPFDDPGNTFYVPLDMEEEQWEKMEFVSGQPEYKILFADDISDWDKKTAIAEGEKFPMIVYDDTSWAVYYVVFTGLPIIDLATNEGFLTENITGTAVFYDTDFSLRGVQQSDYNGHIRGNTSRMFPKKGYKINLTKENGEETEKNKLSLFQMRKDDDWILYAIYNDDTKVRDLLSMEVWDQFGAKAVSEKSYYGPKMTYVEVFADNSYCGLYGLMEPVDRKQMDLSEEDYSYKRKDPGGLVYQYDTFKNEKDPEAEVEGFAVKDGVMDQNAWSAMADLCAALTLPDEEFVKIQPEIIDTDSAVRMWLFAQIITGHDHTAKNVFFVARYDENLSNHYKFYFAPWDMDLTWGNVSVGEINPLYTEYQEDTVDNRVIWEIGDRLLSLNCDGAKEKMQDLYQELRKNALSDPAIEQMIWNLDHQVRDSGAMGRDAVRWPDSAHAESCDYLIDYAKKRLAFLDKALYNSSYLEQ